MEAAYRRIGSSCQPRGGSGPERKRLCGLLNDASDTCQAAGEGTLIPVIGLPGGALALIRCHACFGCDHLWRFSKQVPKSRWRAQVPPEKKQNAAVVAVRFGSNKSRSTRRFPLRRLRPRRRVAIRPRFSSCHVVYSRGFRLTRFLILSPPRSLIGTHAQHYQSLSIKVPSLFTLMFRGQDARSLSLSLLFVCAIKWHQWCLWLVESSLG